MLHRPLLADFLEPQQRMLRISQPKFEVAPGCSVRCLSAG